MKKTQIQTFIKRVLPQRFPEYRVKFIPHKEVSPCSAQVIKKKNKYVIELSRQDFIYQLESTEIKSLLLHELGHIATSNPTSWKGNTTAKEEYKAQMWAIRIASKKGLQRIVKELIDVFRTWAEFDWNQDRGEFRRYILASRIFTYHNPAGRKINKVSGK